MSMAVKPGYVNPLTMTGQRENALTAAEPLNQQKAEAEDGGQDEVQDEVQELQTRQQSLQNSILLLKSTSDGAVGTAKTQEVLQKKLEEITDELKTAKAREARAVTTQPIREKFDRYEKDSGQTVSPGVYQIQKDEESNYKVIFSPYEEQE